MNGDYMKTKITVLLLILVLALSACTSKNTTETSGKETDTTPSTTEETNNDSNSPEQNGIWVTKSYVDEFGDSTYRKYITTEALLSGTFSNTATTNSKLTAKLLIDSTGVSIILYEYGNNQVKSNSTDEYDIIFKYGNKKDEVWGNLQTDRIFIYASQGAKLITALSSGETVSFYIEESKRETTNYRFDVESSNFETEYTVSILGKDITDTTETTEAPTETTSTEPLSPEEEKYQEAQSLVFSSKFDEAYQVLNTIADYKNAKEIMALLENPLSAVYSYTDGSSVNYLWVRETIFFESIGEQTGAAYSSYNAYKWIEYPSINEHSTPQRISQTSSSTSSKLIMNYSYQWDISADRKTIIENEIDTDGNAKGENYRIKWVALTEQKQSEAMERVLDYIS